MHRADAGMKNHRFMETVQAWRGANFGPLIVWLEADTAVQQSSNARQEHSIDQIHRVFITLFITETL